MPYWKIYIPKAGQANAAERASALGAILVDPNVANDPQYVGLIDSLPAVVTGTGSQFTVQRDPSSVSAITGAVEIPGPPAGLLEHLYGDNPHNLTPASISAAPTVHTHPEYEGGGGGPHTHVDADLPAGLARDAEVAAAYSPIGHTHAAGAGVTGAVIRKTANQTMTANTQTAITDMSFAVTSGATYWFRMTIPVTTSTGTSPTTTYGFTGPASTAVAITVKQPTSTSVDAVSVVTALGNFTAGAQVANTMSEFDGVLTASASGTIQLTAARGGTNPSMVIPAGANGVWLRLA